MTNRAEDNIVIRNVYYMMAYAFRALDLGEYRRLATESFENLDDLLAAILVIGINLQRKRGFERDYLETEDDIAGIRGRLDVAGTARHALAGRQITHCAFDEFSEDTYKNRILKRCAEILLSSPEVMAPRKQDLKRCLLAMRDISGVDETRIEWSRLRYHRNNGSYQMLMNVCYMVLNDHLLTEEAGEKHLASFVSDRELNALYEKFILEYFCRHHKDIKATAKIIDNGIEDAPSFLPKLCSDITLEKGNKTLIIDAKCYGKILKLNFGHEIMSPANHNQIVIYVMREAFATEKEVQGMLLYAQTKDEPAKNDPWEEMGHKFWLRTLDLSQEFSGIKSQLDEIAELVR